MPDRERVKPSPPGLFRWIEPVFRTSNSEFIRKCGMDAYLFLRYLRMLLKIFFPLAVLVLPILLPLNKVGGKDINFQNGTDSSPRWNVTGLDRLAWGNVTPEHTHRYWAHLLMAVIVVVYVCAVFFDELTGYIRLRQAYLTSPQHRLRASATTVLVTAIPRNWLSQSALLSLYDVFPGGIRNIWINRNYDELNEKAKQRNALALQLEASETALIRKCKRAQLKQARVAAKKAAVESNEKSVGAAEKAAADERTSQLAFSPGVSSGNPHEVAHSVGEAIHGSADANTNNENQHRSASHHPSVNKLGKSLLGSIKNVGASRGDNTIAGTNGLIPPEKTPPLSQGGDIVGDGIHPSYRFYSSSSESVHTELNYQVPGPSNANEADSRRKQRSWRSRLSSNSKSNVKTGPDRQDDEYPLTKLDTSVGGLAVQDSREPPSRGQDKEQKRDRSQTESEKGKGQKYPIAYNENFDDEDLGEPLWKRYIKEKDRETMRLPIFNISWMPSIWLIGKKVDTIDHCRKELARLNLEIEVDQQNPEKFPLMNSAFIQFNHQVAAHMACQAVSHHLPKQMAPRIVEISPDDVIWDNMSIKWWERYIRTFAIFALVSAMVAGWAFPVAFTGLLSQISYLEQAFPWLKWIETFPTWFMSAIQGVLPPLFLSILMALLPLILRFLCKAQGVHTGMAVELTVQNYYFAFLFVQLFLVVAISSSFSGIFDNATNVTSWASVLAQNIPRSSNYFFSYMILQALSVSAAALVQAFNLVSWFILAPLLDSTARKKWARTMNLSQVQWGTFFPVYTTLASIGLFLHILGKSRPSRFADSIIGLIYSVIAPLILVFNVITFGLFWFVYRYNTLYVTKFRFDTGGLLFPKAINQLFTGLYVMELCLIGLFFLVRDVDGNVACKGQGICMTIVLALTVGYQFLLNEAFGPLIRYLPITLEDDAVKRDEEFQSAQWKRLGLAVDDEEDASKKPQSAGSGNQVKEDGKTQAIELRNIDNPMDDCPQSPSVLQVPKSPSWVERSPNRRSKYFGHNSDTAVPTVQQMREKLAHDAEAQGPSTNTVGRALFAGIHAELEDLTPDERDLLVQRAFQHEALRAKRPVIWIPRDDLGVSDDEIYRTQQFSKHIWISNEYQALDGKCRPIFSRSPPDFSEVDLIQL